jgi:hypothetical protein
MNTNHMVRWLAFASVLGGVGGCAEKQPGAKPQQPETTAGPVENLEPAPPPPAEASRLGQMPLLRGAPSDGRCSSRVMSTGKRFIMEGDAPLRTITVELGPATRPFVPTFVEVKAKQSRGDGQEENEMVYVGFTETGAMDMGRRQYFLTGTAPKDVAPPTAEDGEAAKQLALQVIQRCQTP